MREDEILGKVERIYGRRKYMGGVRKFEEYDGEGRRI